MKICIMTGAIKNAGDYLIAQRSEQLLRRCFPDAHFMNAVRNYPIDTLEEINSCDVIVFAGGPSYRRNLYPGGWPLVDDLNLLKPKLFILGAGWKGYDHSPNAVETCRFNSTTLKLLKRVESDSHVLGCRDFYSVRVLKRNNLNGVMTGCPAWYDLNYVDKTTFSTMPDLRTPKLICVSDPADTHYYRKQAIDLLKYLKNTFPQTEIKFIFHRGYETDASLKTEIEKMGIETQSIAFGCDGFSLYDECDFHIGYRVHSHIYNLSRRKLSILLNEDGRGAGASEAVGVLSIPAYNKKIDYKSSLFKRGINKYFNKDKVNHWAIQVIDDYLSILLSDNFYQYQMAFVNMNHYFKEMEKHIMSIRDIINGDTVFTGRDSGGI